MTKAHHFFHRKLVPLLVAGLWVPGLSALPNGMAASCGGCHYAEAEGGGTTPSPSVTAIASATRIEPGEQVDITVMVQSAWPDARVAGFLVMSESEAGVFTAIEEGTGNVGTEAGVGLDYAIGHIAARELEAGAATFRATWTAPMVSGTYDFDVYAVTSDDGDGVDDEGESQERNDSYDHFQLSLGVGCDLLSYYYDGDMDGYGGDERFACEQPPGYVTEGGDCLDNEPAANPGAVEQCSFLDEDCDGEPMAPPTFYGDADGDGYGEAFDIRVDTCTLPPGYASEAGDCAPNDPNVHPGAIELADNGVDDNCDGTIDEPMAIDEPVAPVPTVAPDATTVAPATSGSSPPTNPSGVAEPAPTGAAGGPADVPAQMYAGGGSSTGCGISPRRRGGFSPGLGAGLLLLFGSYFRRRVTRTRSLPHCG